MRETTTSVSAIILRALHEAGEYGMGRDELLLLIQGHPCLRGEDIERALKLLHTFRQARVVRTLRPFGGRSRETWYAIEPPPPSSIVDHEA